MSSSLRTLLATTTEEMLHEGRCTIEAIVEQASRNDPEVWAHASVEATWASARVIIRGLLRKFDDDFGTDEQLALPGLHLPRAIAVRTDKEQVYYVAAEVAHWDELQAGRKERVCNIDAAVGRLDTYDRSLSMLRPSMENDPNMTVAEAMRRIHHDQVA